MNLQAEGGCRRIQSSAEEFGHSFAACAGAGAAGASSRNWQEQHLL